MSARGGPPPRQGCAERGDPGLAGVAAGGAGRAPSRADYTRESQARPSRSFPGPQARKTPEGAVAPRGVGAGHVCGTAAARPVHAALGPSGGDSPAQVLRPRGDCRARGLGWCPPRGEGLRLPRSCTALAPSAPPSADAGRGGICPWSRPERQVVGATWENGMVLVSALRSVQQRLGCSPHEEVGRCVLPPELQEPARCCPGAAGSLDLLPSAGARARERRAGSGRAGRRAPAASPHRAMAQGGEVRALRAGPVVTVLDSAGSLSSQVGDSAGSLLFSVANAEIQPL
ncbi:collagen alpha-2(I) chain-like [Vidua macroura]|uniref:collagen alpha-2(I) chain-like n=1 Tax=Vidua macroura TaxID=187451 RepID=UPI0023A7FDE9|nr:collagen alpha-2(I) chain-like [Vidua macroura]